MDLSKEFDCLDHELLLANFPHMALAKMRCVLSTAISLIENKEK